MASGRRRRDSIHETPDVSFITNPDVAHEESDVAVRPLLWFVGGLTAFTIVVCVVVLLMFMYFQRREESQELEASPLARQGAERLPPEPRLQLAPGFGVTTDDGQKRDLFYKPNTQPVPQPQSEYLLLRDEWRRELEDYGWADQKAGTVRVPVEQAMQLYLQRQQSKQQGAPPANAQQPAPGSQK
ncbi:MAG: hypothetical protein M3444_10640 [Acidobacteriota bacterium]|nr:hypothetical protein [Acidobacteriota bacterium]MDQ5836332.1 hypothetical protein [Acidobacteriota bacterium]